MEEQISFLGKGFMSDEEIADLEAQEKVFSEYAHKKRRWENAFQKWSDNHGCKEDGTESWGACGYGSMCDYCKDNSYGRPCVRALNAMLREKGRALNYTEKFEDVWTSV